LIKKSLLVFVLLPVCVVAQQFNGIFSNGQIYTSDGSVLHINGNVKNNGSLLLNGSTFISDSVFNYGTLANNGNLNSNGHWFQNGSMPLNSGTIRFSGSMQSINGNSVFRTHRLLAQGNDTLFLFTDVDATLQLKLLATSLKINNQTLRILHPSDTSLMIQNASLVMNDNGKIVRHFSQGEWRNIPFVSSNKSRFIAIKPTDSGLLGIQLKNSDPSDSGYSRTYVDSLTCRINDTHFYLLSKEGGTITAYEVEIRSTYDVDFAFPSLSAWSSDGEGKWFQYGANTTLNNGILSVFSNTIISENPQAIALSRKKPDTPILSGTTELCSGDVSTYSVVNPQPGLTYVWSASNGTGGTSESFSLTPVNAGTLSINLTASDTFNCSSFSGLFQTTVHPLPIANLEVEEPPLAFAGETFLFNGSSSSGYDSFVWDLPVNSAANSIVLPYTFSAPGQYDVGLIVYTDFGCSDTAFYSVLIEEGLVIPTVFTPNGDGYNDYWTIKHSVFSAFDLKIFNRHGQMVFESNGPAINWNGTSINQEPCTDGTYFYILKADLPTKTIVRKGNITLIR
jgi:gliding motility-associated-like protein